MTPSGFSRTHSKNLNETMQKIASTMASTGTPSHFVSPAEATHGDLGMIKKGDVLLIVSNSGETLELIQLLPLIKKKVDFIELGF